MSSDINDLESLDPESGVELFLEHKSTDCRPSIVKNHCYRMKHFLEWSNEIGLDNLNGLSGRDVQQYRLWPSNETEINAITMKNVLFGFRVFLKWAGSMEAATEDLYSKRSVIGTRSNGHFKRSNVEQNSFTTRLATLIPKPPTNN